VRPRLVTLLGDRFGHPLTTVVAGAGFGKTTALAQAFRANLAAPRGFEAWVSCETADEDPRRLAEAIVTALVPAAPVDDPLASVQRTIRKMAPVDVCVILDDVHEIPSGSGGEHLVAEFVGSLPPHAHVLLASRRAVPVPLAERRAAGQLVELDADDLAFELAEATALARMHGQAGAHLPDLGGWPSLVALALSARRGAAMEFLWEEILAALPSDDRRTLLAMTTLGWGTLDDAIAVGGDDVCASSLGRLVRTVPLISGDEERFSVHQLWEDAAGRIFEESELADARRRTLELLATGGDPLRLGSAAIRWRDTDALLAATVAMVRDSLGTLPIETAQRWLAAARVDVRDEPELRMLALAVRRALRVGGAEVDAEFDGLIEELRHRPGAVGCSEAIALAAVSAYDRRDVARLGSLAALARSLPASRDVPLLRFLSGAIDASTASVAGDADTALQIIDTLPFDQVPVRVTELVARMRVVLLSRTGRVEEAVSAAQWLSGSTDPHVRLMPSYMRWQSGDPAEFAINSATLHGSGSINDRDRFSSAAEIAVISSSLGDRNTARAAREQIAAYLDGRDDARDSAVGSGAIACTHVLDHDEPAARRAIDTHLARYPVSNRPGMLHLQRHFAVGYALSEQLRERWDGVDLAPARAITREVARRFLEARDGELDPSSTIPDAGQVVTSLPLPWSAELAAAACRLGVPGGHELASALAGWTHAATRTELERLASGDGDHTIAAAALLADLPVDPGPLVRIDMLGPMRLTVGGQPVDRPELRRLRVRTVLALLAVRGPLRRDQIIDVVWPDADPDGARQSLRTTLSRIRRLLDPGGSTSHGRLRTDGERISLAGPPWLDVDLWEFRRLVGAEEEANRSGVDSLDRLQEAVALWRGDPIPDLESAVGLDADLERVRSELVDSCLRLGEQLLALGEFAQALECVERCEPSAPYSERVHRLAIAALVQLRDRDGLTRRLRALSVMLDDLGVEPERETTMLLARAREVLGDHADVM
jgi:DNA-binding SARP family transcriptional activator